MNPASAPHDGRDTHACAVDGADYTFALEPNGDARIVRCNSDNCTLDVPEHLDGHRVTAIGPMAFAGLDKLEAIVLPHSVTSMGKRMFSQCRRLRRVILPAGLTALDETWLMDCAQLQEVALPGGVEAVDAKFLKQIHPQRLAIGRATKSIDFPNGWAAGLQEIAVSSDNEHLTTDGACLYTKDGSVLVAAAACGPHYRIPRGCRVIGPRAFAYHGSVRTLELPDTLEAIGNLAFMGSSLETLAVPASVRSIEAGAFMRCSALRHVELGEGIKLIGDGAFSSCPQLQGLALPASLQTLGRQVVDNSPRAADWATGAFRIDPANTHLHVDDAGVLYALEDGAWTLRDVLGSQLVHYDVRPGTKAIGENAFVGQTRLRSVTLPHGLTAIGPAAFRGCQNLVHVAAPDTLETIGDYALFATSLRDFTLPASVRSIGLAAFGVEHRNGTAAGSSGPGSGASAASNASGSGAPGSGPPGAPGSGASGASGVAGRGAGDQRPILSGFAVQPGNPAFFSCGGVLYERTGEGEQLAVLYTGPERSVELLPGTTGIAAFAFSGTDDVDSLKIPRSVRSLGICALALDRPPRIVDIAPAWHDPDRPYLRVHMLQDKFGLRAWRNAFSSGTVEARALFEEMDQAAIWSFNRVERACYLVRRLAHPDYLAAQPRRTYAEELREQPRSICLAIAEANWPAGFDHMVDLGFLTADNITPVIDAVSRAGFVAMTAYLMTLKGARFGADDDYAL